MNYAITTLNQSVECNNIKYPDIPSLKFGTTPKGVGVFNVVEYCEQEDIEFDTNKFLSSYRIYIDRLIKTDIIKADGILFVCKDNVYMASGLEQLFLMYVNPELFLYFMQIIETTLTTGIFISDGMLVNLVADRVPNDVLTDIVKARNEQEEKDN